LKDDFYGNTFCLKVCHYYDLNGNEFMVTHSIGRCLMIVIFIIS